MAKTYIQSKLVGTPGQIVSFDVNSNPTLKSINSNVGAFLQVTVPEDSVVTATDNISIITVSASSNIYPDPDTPVGGVTYRVNLPRMGTWNVVSILAGVSSSRNVIVNGTGTYKIKLSYFEATIAVNYLMGMTCTCSNGVTTLTDTDGSGYYIFTVDEPGTWTVTATSSLGSISDQVIIATAGQSETINLDIADSTLENNSWAVIQQVAKCNLGSSYWAVGDTKEIEMNGKVAGLTLTDFSVKVFIIGFDHNSELEGTGITFQLGKKDYSGTLKDIALVYSYGNSSSTSENYFSMNYGSSYGGWAGCYMRTRRLSQFFNALPSDLQNVIKPAIKYSTNDTSSGTYASANLISATLDPVFLLSEYEVFATTTKSNPYEASYQEQYSYYANSNNSKIKYQHNSDTSAAIWWLRNVYITSSSYSSDSFTYVSTSGTASYGSYSYSRGCSPAFLVG